MGLYAGRAAELAKNRPMTGRAGKEAAVKMQESAENCSIGQPQQRQKSEAV